MTQLSHEVGYSVGNIQNALEQMEQMGYIRHEHFEQSCNSCCRSDRGSHCEGCGFSSSDKFTIWVLTERGEAIADSQANVK